MCANRVSDSFSLFILLHLNSFFCARKISQFSELFSKAVIEGINKIDGSMELGNCAKFTECRNFDIYFCQKMGLKQSGRYTRKKDEKV